MWLTTKTTAYHCFYVAIARFLLQLCVTVYLCVSNLSVCNVCAVLLLLSLNGKSRSLVHCDAPLHSAATFFVQPRGIFVTFPVGVRGVAVLRRKSKLLHSLLKLN